MDKARYRSTIARIVADTTSAQGVPERLEDPAAVLKVATVARRSFEAETAN